MENKKINIGIVAAEFNYDVTYAMVELAKEHAKFLNADVVEIMKVPGTYDIPFGVKILLSKKNIDCVVTLGAVIEGQTEHDEIISQQASRKIMDLSLESGKPVALGISGPGMSRLEAYERVDYAKRAIEAAVKMCRIKFASEKSNETKIEEEAKGKVEAKEGIGAKEEVKKITKGKRGRPKKAKSEIKEKKGETKEKVTANTIAKSTAKHKIIDDKEKEQIIEELKKNGKITTKRVMEMFKVSRFTAIDAINYLLEKGWIKRNGEKNETYYTLV